jgi:LPPG:FO 2-phospho-L-lactate transferase
LITALAGGVGAAKLLLGMSKIVDQKQLRIVGNTGDDIELHGLHISPDLDIVAYTLAGIVDETKGWGIQNDTFHCLDVLKRLGEETWFQLGDRDLATHIFRTNLLRNGNTLSKATRQISRALALEAEVLPMTDDKFETRIRTKDGIMHFEEYMVKRGAKDEVLGVEFFGAEKAKPAVGVVEAILRADRVVVCPSNPVVSIGTILAVQGIREVLRQTKARKVAVSPIVAGSPIKGPADKLLRGLGFEVSAFSVAKLYADFLDVFVVDVADAGEKERIEEFGLEVKVAETVMRSLEDKVRLAKVVLEA